VKFALAEAAIFLALLIRPFAFPCGTYVLAGPQLPRP
jgi:hypothetical protein